MKDSEKFLAQLELYRGRTELNLQEVYDILQIQVNLGAARFAELEERVWELEKKVAGGQEEPSGQ